MFKLEFDMSVGVKRKLQRIRPFVAEGGLFPWAIIPSLAGNLASSTPYAFIRIN
jgi:hypothetical protein